MNVEVRCRPAYAMAYCRLDYQERVFVEREAMAAMSDHVHVAATTGGTGVARALFRQATVGEGALFSAYTAEVQDAWVALCPRTPGDIATVMIEPDDCLVVQAGSLLAYGEGVQPHVRYGGLRGILMREGLLFIKMSGSGIAVLSAYGGIERLELADGESLIVDTGHLVAFSDTMDYEVGPLGSIATSALTGEGLVSRFTGPGVVLIQTRAEAQLRSWLSPDRK